MKYPISHKNRIEEIEDIVSKWPVEKNFDHILKWLMQFDTEDIDIGVRIIRNLNVIGFEDLNTSLSIAYSKLERVAIDKGSKVSNKNTLFAGIGDGAKSGAMIGYNFRIVNELSEENFMSEETLEYLEQGRVENIVLVDDIIGTGDQASKEIKSLTEKVTPFGVKNIFLLTAVGMTDGIKNVVDETKAHVFSAFEYSNLDTASNLDSIFYEDIPHEQRAKLKSRLEYYGRVSNKAPLGYGGIGALIAFYYNTPNISLPVIWGSMNSWIPLFRRAVKINGINAYYKQIDAAMKKKKEEKKAVIGKENEFVLLVEGKIDEVFYDYIVSNIKESTSFEKYSVIALGGYSSKSLIDNVSRLSRNYLFILEEDDEANIERIRKNIGSHPHLLVKSVDTFLDMDKLSKDDRWGKYFLTVSMESVGHRGQMYMRRPILELFSRLRSQPSLLKDFFMNYTDKIKVKELEKVLIEKLKEISTKIILPNE